MLRIRKDICSFFT